MGSVYSKFLQGVTYCCVIYASCYYLYSVMFKSKPMVNIKEVYVGCAAESEIDGKKISSIIKYVLREKGLKAPGNNAGETYNKYCKALQRKLKYFVPYSASVEMKKIERQTIVKQMENLLPKDAILYKLLIEEAAEEVITNSSIMHSRLLNIMKYNIVSEFVAFKVFQSGDSLELTPCYMAARKKMGFFYSIVYKQEKFTLSKFDIAIICSKLENGTNKPEAD